MNKAPRLSFLLATLATVTPTIVSAHPGHDDGHELTWDFSHLASHPFATLLCATVIATAVWLAIRLANRSGARPAAKSDPADSTRN